MARTAPSRKKNLWPFSSGKKRVVRSPEELRRIAADVRAAEDRDLERMRQGGKPAKGRQSEGKGTAGKEQHQVASLTYHGYQIKPTGDGAFFVPKFDPESHFDSIRDAKRFLDSWKKNPKVWTKAVKGVQSATRSALKLYDSASGTLWNVTGGIPRRIVGHLVAEKGNPRNPRNPESGASEMYESFHGKPAEGLTIVKEEIHEHEWLAPLGVLVNFRVLTLTGLDALIGVEEKEAKLEDYDESEANADTIFLASNEAGTQLYFRGGDQSLDLDALKFKGDWVKDDMIIGVVYEVTYRTRKKFDKFELTDYFHHLGEETLKKQLLAKLKDRTVPIATGDQPLLRYDPLSPHLYVTGGKYKIKVPLIGMSPGIEN